MKIEKKSLILSTVYFVVGCVLLVLCQISVSESMLLVGLGSGFVAAALVRFARIFRYRIDSKYHQNVDISLQDERLIALRTKAWAYTGYLMIALQGIGAGIAFAVHENLIASILLCTVSLSAIIFWIAYLILRTKS